jgi:hypothetical protein
MHRSSELLHRALSLNAVFSAVSAVALLLASGWFAAQLGLPGRAPVLVTGTLLGLFALQLTWIVRARRIRRREILGIIAADVAWVGASILLGILYYDRLTTVGAVLVFGVALVVLTFAELQGLGLRRMHRA